MSPKMSCTLPKPAPPPPPHAVLEGGVAVLVVGAALGAVAQHFVGFLGFLEGGLGILVAGLVAIRVVLHRQAAISLLDLVLAGAARDAQGFVVIALAHRGLICNSVRRLQNSARDDRLGGRRDAGGGRARGPAILTSGCRP
jgi:hypothetical protein